jgi:hypothetical protein
MRKPPRACVRCHAERAWSGRLCWDCHRAYAAALRTDPRGAAGVVQGLVIGLATVVGAIGAGAPGFVALAVVPIAMLFGANASSRHRRAWIRRTAATLPEARALPSREPDSDTDR